MVDSQRQAIQKLQIWCCRSGWQQIVENRQRQAISDHPGSRALAVDIATLTTLVTMTDLIVSIDGSVSIRLRWPRASPGSAPTGLRNANSGSAAGQTVAIVDTGVRQPPVLSPRVVSEACYSSGSSWFAIDHDEHGVCPGLEPWSTATGAAAPCGLANCEHGTHVACNCCRAGQPRRCRLQRRGA